MRVLVASGEFKGTLSSKEACRAIASGIRKAHPGWKVELMPISDGGDGLLEALTSAPHAKFKRMTVSATGPMGEKIKAPYLLWKKKGQKISAVIESAKICGLALVPPNRRNPMLASTYGLGEVMLEALRHRVGSIYVGLGGSATVEAGSGMAQAMGVKISDSQGKSLGLGCSWLIHAASMNNSKLKKRLRRAKVYGITDVKNPLLGAKGAARVFGPQKGATPEQVEAMERSLTQWAHAAKESLKKDVSKLEGAGAAGGLGAGLMVFCDAKLLDGAETVFDLVEARRRIKEADLVVVGEGRLDKTTLYGKAPYSAAQLAKKLGKKTVGLFGSAAAEASGVARRMGLSHWAVVSPKASNSAVSVDKAFLYLERGAARLFKTIP